MSTADVALVILILFGAFSGYRQGFLMTFITLAAIILGVIGGFKLMGYAMVYLADAFDLNESILPYAAFAAVFLLILILVRLLGQILKFSIDKTFLGPVDQAAGAGLGLLKAAFMLSVALWILEALNFELPENWTSDSWLLPWIESFAPKLTAWIGDIVPLFKDVMT